MSDMSNDPKPTLEQLLAEYDGFVGSRDRLQDKVSIMLGGTALGTNSAETHDSAASPPTQGGEVIRLFGS